MRKLLVTILFLSLIAVVNSAQKKNPSSPFFFIQVTDPQFGMYDSNKGFTKETELYEKAVSEINKLKPDFVVITGDLVNDKDNKAQIAEFKRITAKIDSKTPVYYSPGNHDIGQSPEQQDIDIFIDNYGHDRFSFRHKKSLFIGFNTCIVKANAPLLEKEQFDWLKKKLSSGRRSEQIILLTHYPLFISNPDEPETYSNISVDTRKRYLSLLSEYGVDAVFAGHLHNNASAKFGDIKLITTSAVGKPLGNVPSGIRIVKVYHDRTESVYYPLDEIPSVISY